MRRCEFCDSPVPADAIVCPVCNETIAEETLERVLPILKRPETPEIRAMGVLDRFWGVIRRPAAAYRDIGRRPDGAGPLMIIIMNALVMAGLFLAVSSKLYVRVNINGTLTDVGVLSSQYSTQFYGTALVSILPNILLGMVYLLVGTLFAHLAFKVTGGTGSKGKTMSVIGYSMFPVILIRLVALPLILFVLPVYNVTASTSWVGVVMSVYESSAWLTIDYITTASFFWVGLLLVFGIREAHDTSTGWAFVVSAACMVVLIWTFWQAH
ncbi:hypothetical protein EU546_07630 [Candidatus Thorarchaeota archaeon]|nr:MAG: hypothetical protein EU546_07630 [Candidatus Thorarchaeota archaeon]